MLPALSHFLPTLEARAEWLTVLVVAGYLVGSLLAQRIVAQALQAASDAVRRLGQKLDREQRGAATLVYRGMVAVLILLLPALLIGALLSRPVAWVSLASSALLMLWLGHCFATWPNLALLRRMKASLVPLQLPALPYLFADGHAVIRYLIERRMEAFASGVVGTCCWYLAGGWVLLATYLTLAHAARLYRARLAFGWAARSLFALMDMLPRLLSRGLLALAAVFTPHCHPLASAFAPNWRSAVARTLGVSLGGTTPEGEQPWVGDGSPRLAAADFRRCLHLLLAATLLLVLLLSSSVIYDFYKALR